MSHDRLKEFKPLGPVAEAYMADVTHRVQIIRGPIASGKTVTSEFKALNVASRLMPICKDGVIHCKLAVAGVTYGQLERNLYPTWHYWLPKDGGWTEGEWEGGRGRFAEQKLKFWVIRKDRRVLVDFQVVFAAIGELSVEQFVRGFEPSMWYLYEVDQFPDGIIEQAIGRLGRWPNFDMLPNGATWNGLVFGDTNSADTDSWYYRTFEETQPPGWKQYVQPGADTPQAEGIYPLKNPGYYPSLMAANAHKPKWVRRFIQNKYGPAGDGDPVYEQSWDPAVHMSPTELRATKGRGVVLAFDQGLRPACLVLQRQASGQMRAIGEVFNDRMSVRRFAAAIRDELSIVAPGEKVIDAWGDPAGFTGTDDQDSGDLSWMDLLFNELVPDVLAEPILPADTNNPDICITAVEDELLHMVAAGIPSLLVSPRCKWLKKGFDSEYKFEKRAETRDQVKRPLKNLYANVHNALQYGLVGEKGRHGVVIGKRDKNAPERRTAARRELEGAAADYHVAKAPVDLG